MLLLYQIKFGTIKKKNRSHLEDVIQEYLAALMRVNQICGDYFLTLTNGVLNAHVMVGGNNAFALRYHSDWGKVALEKVVESFGKRPQWILLDDDFPGKRISWKNSPFLYLFTDSLESAPEICRGDNGSAIPTYLLPLSYKEREEIYFWAIQYRNFHSVWLASGALEKQAYKQIVNPKSETSFEGRRICGYIERKTGIPTYYYLMRYWERHSSEEEAKCPDCGRVWKKAIGKVPPRRFWHFNFHCSRCRLASVIVDPGLYKLDPEKR